MQWDERKLLICKYGDIKTTQELFSFFLLAMEVYKGYNGINHSSRKPPLQHFDFFIGVLCRENYPADEKPQKPPIILGHN